MTAFTSSQSGNWSSSSTWGGVGVPGIGDTASIGAHTVTVDTNTTVGTSPNDATTKVVDRTSGSSVLIIAAGVTFTVRGNIGGANAVQLTLQAGAALVFDNAASGGSPVYTFVNVGGDRLTCNGTSGSRAAIRAISGQTCALNQATAFNTVDYTDFTRVTINVTNAALNSVSGTIIRNCAFDSCTNVRISQNNASLDFIFDDNIFSNSTDSMESLRVTLGTTASSGRRSISRNYLDKSFNNQAKSLIMDDNFMGGISCFTSGTTTFARKPRRNVIDNTLNLNGGNGMLMTGSWDSLYVINNVAAGNPHFISPSVTNGVDETYSRVIFESNSPDLLDTGDCFLPNAAFCSSGLKAIFRNSIVLRNPTTGVTSGQCVTSYAPPATATTHKMEIYHNTMNQNKTGVGGVGLRACIAFSEAGTGAADQIAALKSNLGWATATGNGYFAERIQGTVDGHITAANADRNWVYNLEAGDNGRGYEDRANSPGQDLWAAGNADGSDAAAAGVDNNQGSGDPGFIDSTRCMATWAVARGYGTTQADALAAIKANRTRIGDLFDHVFQGFKVTNSAMRIAGHDGACTGAANFDRSRNLAAITAARGALALNYPGAAFQ